MAFSSPFVQGHSFIPTEKTEQLQELLIFNL